MTYASGSFGQLRYIEETARGVVPVVGNATNLRMVQPTMKAAIDTIKSSEVNQNRMSSGNTRVDQSVDGGFDFELSAEEMALVHALAKPTGRIVSPPGLAPGWDVAA